MGAAILDYAISPSFSTTNLEHQTGFGLVVNEWALKDIKHQTKHCIYQLLLRSLLWVTSNIYSCNRLLRYLKATFEH